VQVPLFSVVLAFVLTLVVTPFVAGLAFRWGAVDRPDQRKVHEKLMPRLGGLAIYAGFAAGVLFAGEITAQVAGLLAGGTLILVLGIIDDTRGISPRVKLAGQVAAACAVVPFGLKVDFLTNPFADGLITLGILSAPVTVLWIVSVTNAMNLIDGLDGLAGGTTCIAALTLAAVVWIKTVTDSSSPGQLEAIVLACILAASVIGFLRYNFYPARIFLGDSGSMFLGFSVAVLAVMGLAKSATFISVIIPIVILGMPIIDTVFAIVRRYCGNKSILQPDKEHLHHRLLQMGMSHRQAVLCLYGVNVVLGLSAITMTLISPGQAAVFLVFLSTAVIVLANKIGFTAGSRSAYLPGTSKEQRSTRM